MNEFIAARVHPWQAFRARKWAEHKGVSLGLILTEAIQAYLASESIPPELIEEWLKEYRKTHYAVD